MEAKYYCPCTLVYTHCSIVTSRNAVLPQVYPESKPIPLSTNVKRSNELGIKRNLYRFKRFVECHLHTLLAVYFLMVVNMLCTVYNIMPHVMGSSYVLVLPLCRERYRCKQRLKLLVEVCPLLPISLQDHRSSTERIASAQ